MGKLFQLGYGRAADHDRRTPRCMCRQKIAFSVADEEGTLKIEVVLRSGTPNQTRLWFPALATIRCAVGAIVNTQYPSAMRPNLGNEPERNFVEVCGGHDTLSHSCLV